MFAALNGGRRAELIGSILQLVLVVDDDALRLLACRLAAPPGVVTFDGCGDVVRGHHHLAEAAKLEHLGDEKRCRNHQHALRSAPWSRHPAAVAPQLHTSTGGTVVVVAALIDVAVICVCPWNSETVPVTCTTWPGTTVLALLLSKMKVPSDVTDRHQAAVLHVEAAQALAPS